MENSKESKVVQLLAKRRSERQEDLSKYISDPGRTESDTDGEGYSDTPVLDKFLHSSARAVVEVTNYSLNEFNALWNVVREKVDSDWNGGSRRKFQQFPKHVLFILLYALKHAGNWDFNRKCLVLWDLHSNA